MYFSDKNTDNINFVRTVGGTVVGWLAGQTRLVGDPIGECHAPFLEPRTAHTGMWERHLHTNQRLPPTWYDGRDTILTGVSWQQLCNSQLVFQVILPRRKKILCY